MAIIKEEIDLNVSEGTMAVVIFRDNDSAPRPAIVLVHDANGLLPATLDIARGLAENGFVVAAPDVYHRVGRMQTSDPALPIPDKMWLREGMTNEGHLLDMNALAAHLQRQGHVSDGLVGVTGFCLGGRIAFLAASRGEGFGPSVLFYPTRLCEPDPAFAQTTPPITFAGGVTSPMLTFFPELDSQNPPENIKAINAALAASPAESVVVPNAAHGFAQPGTPEYHREEGPIAWQRCVDFFVEYL